MRTNFLCLFLAFLAPNLLLGQPLDDAVNSPAASWQKEVDGFAATLLLTRQPERFLNAWAQSPRADSELEIQNAKQAARGEPAVAFVLFAGCLPGATGHCDATVDFRVLRPDGSEYATLEEAELWQGKEAPAEGFMELGATSLGVAAEPEDPLGIYTLTARVCDRLAGRCVNLERVLEVLAPEAALDLNEFLHRYYLDPRPVLVEPAMRTLSTEKLLLNAEARPPIIGFFAMVFLENPEFLPRWTAVMADLEVHAQETLKAAIALSKAPSALTLEESPSPARNDMLWGAYFATGREEYVHAIVERMKHLEERQNRHLFLTAASAQWSLCANAKGHPAVAQILRELHASGNTWRQDIDDALTKNPEDISQATEEVLRSQRAKGIW